MGTPSAAMELALVALSPVGLAEAARGLPVAQFRLCPTASLFVN